MAAEMVYLRNVVTLELDLAACTSCGMCAVVCPRAVLAVDDGVTRIVERDRCIECGACSRNCPTGAITVEAGVGCATAVINAALGREGSCCCCVAPAGGARQGDGC